MSSEPPPTTPADEWPTRENTVLAPPPGDTGAGAPPGPPPGEPDRRLGQGLLLGLLVAGVAAAAIAVAWYMTRDDDGQSGTTQVETTVTETTTTSSSDSATTTVQPVSVPDVVGRSQREATAAIDSVGLRANPFDVPSDRSTGEVVAQHPSAGQQAEPGTAVRINVSKSAGGAATTTGTTTTGTTTTGTTTTGTTTTAPPPPQTAIVPDIVGSEMSSAVQQLGQAGLLASVQYVPGEEPFETVRAQSPAADSSVKHLSHVTVNVSSGPGEKPRRTLPDVVGQSLDPAVAAVNAAGLRLVYLELPVTDGAQVGKIVEQTPAAGRSAPQNAQVLVYVGATG